MKLFPSSSLCLLPVLCVACDRPGAGRDSRTGRVGSGEPSIVMSHDVELPEPADAVPPLETVAANHPNDPDRLLVGVRQLGITAEGSQERTVAYVSADAGRRWTRITPTTPQTVTGDNAVALGRGDTIYVVVIHYPQPNPIALYRSVDGGKSWPDTTIVARDALIDRQYILLDDTLLHVVAMGYPAKGGIVPLRGPGLMPTVLTSTDRGRSFGLPVQMPGPVPASLAVGTPGMLSNGTLVIPYWQQDSAGRSIHVTYWNGGRTLSSPIRVSVVGDACGGIEERSGGAGGVPAHLAIDQSKGPFHDRIYVVWSDSIETGCEIHVAHSSDGGRSWSRPAIASDLVGQLDVAENFVPAVTVNARGVVGVFWHTRRGVPISLAVPRFSASLDGGVSFSPSVSVAAEIPKAPAQHDIRVMSVAVPDYLDTARAGAQRATLTLVAIHGPHEFGDLQTMTTDGGGDFHPFWNDYRSGRARLRTSTISVRGTVVPNGDSVLARMRDVSSSVAIRYRELGFDAASGVYTVQAHLKNVSGRSLSGPFKLRLTALAPTIQLPSAPSVVQAANGLSGAGAVWDCSSAVQGGVLAPGATSGPITLRFRMPPINPEVLRPRAVIERKAVLRIALQVLAEPGLSRE